MNVISRKKAEEAIVELFRAGPLFTDRGDWYDVHAGKGDVRRLLLLVGMRVRLDDQGSPHLVRIGEPNVSLLTGGKPRWSHP